ncbi:MULTISPECIES: hypothetical protein [unclassified Pseudomonas]|uniref:hypothetical protein n=1 Tax=unclassified Pseudomonas TaxID=196821 RepID=UPI00200C2470|nr:MULTISPECIES: hypothetical protein [unclassified Pseudomonas]
MNPSPLAKLALAALLSSLSMTSFAAQPGTGPTDPLESPQPPLAPGGINPGNNPVINNGATPPGTESGIDPRTQGNDPGRQGGMNTDGNGPVGDEARSNPGGSRSSGGTENKLPGLGSGSPQK